MSRLMRMVTEIQMKMEFQIILIQMMTMMAFLTRFEVSEETGLGAPENFETAEGIANYLNKEQTDKLEHNQYIDHKISRNYGYQILVDNLKFERQDGSGEAIQYETYNFGTLRASNVDFPQCPIQDPACNGETPDQPAPDETN